MQLGVSLPVVDIGTGPSAIRDYAQAAEGLGYSHLVAPDHVLGVNPAADHGGQRVGTTANPYHDPFVLFGFLAGCTQSIGFAVGVLILAQRQAVLVAKQAASLDVLSGGRFRLGIGVGWNEEALFTSASRRPNAATARSTRPGRPSTSSRSWASTVRCCSPSRSWIRAASYARA